MNAITKAILDIKFSIPREVLEIAFLQTNRDKNELTGLDERIRYTVIYNKVLLDANLVGGVHLNVDLNDCDIEELDERYTLITVPNTILRNRSIVSALSIVSGVPEEIEGDTELFKKNNTALAYISGTNSGQQTARLELMGKNKVLIADVFNPTGSEFLRLVIENDSELNNLNPRSIPAFSKLAVLATKAYIVNKLEVELEKGYIYRGHELTSINNIISRYSDSLELYNDYLRTTWAKVQFMDDGNRFDRHIKHMFNPNI